MSNDDGVLDDEAFDLGVASARIYGREVALLMRDSPDLRDRVLAILHGQTHDPEDSALARAMGRQCSPQYDRRVRLVTGFATGVHEGA
jgi:hypothetical protein